MNKQLVIHTGILMTPPREAIEKLGHQELYDSAEEPEGACQPMEIPLERLSSQSKSPPLIQSQNDENSSSHNDSHTSSESDSESSSSQSSKSQNNDPPLVKSDNNANSTYASDTESVDSLSKVEEWLRENAEYLDDWSKCPSPVDSPTPEWARFTPRSPPTPQRVATNQNITNIVEQKPPAFPPISTPHMDLHMKPKIPIAHRLMNIAMTHKNPHSVTEQWEVPSTSHRRAPCGAHEVHESWNTPPDSTATVNTPHVALSQTESSNTPADRVTPSDRASEDATLRSNVHRNHDCDNTPWRESTARAAPKGAFVNRNENHVFAPRGRGKERHRTNFSRREPYTPRERFSKPGREKFQSNFQPKPYWKRRPKMANVKTTPKKRDAKAPSVRLSDWKRDNPGVTDYPSKEEIDGMIVCEALPAMSDARPRHVPLREPAYWRCIGEASTGPPPPVLLTDQHTGRKVWWGPPKEWEIHIKSFISTHTSSFHTKCGLKPVVDRPPSQRAPDFPTQGDHYLCLKCRYIVEGPPTYRGWKDKPARIRHEYTDHVLVIRVIFCPVCDCTFWTYILCPKELFAHLRRKGIHKGLTYKDISWSNYTPEEIEGIIEKISSDPYNMLIVADYANHNFKECSLNWEKPLLYNPCPPTDTRVALMYDLFLPGERKKLQDEADKRRADNLPEDSTPRLTTEKFCWIEPGTESGGGVQVQVIDLTESPVDPSQSVPASFQPVVDLGERAPDIEDQSVSAEAMEGLSPAVKPKTQTVFTRKELIAKRKEEKAREAQTEAPTPSTSAESPQPVLKPGERVLSTPQGDFLTTKDPEKPIQKGVSTRPPLPGPLAYGHREEGLEKLVTGPAVGGPPSRDPLFRPGRSLVQQHQPINVSEQIRGEAEDRPPRSSKIIPTSAVVKHPSWDAFAPPTILQPDPFARRPYNLPEPVDLSRTDIDSFREANPAVPDPELDITLATEIQGRGVRSADLVPMVQELIDAQDLIGQGSVRQQAVVPKLSKLLGRMREHTHVAEQCAYDNAQERAKLITQMMTGEIFTPRSAQPPDESKTIETLRDEVEDLQTRLKETERRKNNAIAELEQTQKELGEANTKVSKLQQRILELEEIQEPARKKAKPSDKE